MPFAFMDIHHHIIYGVDDGPKSCLEMFAMLKAAYEDGIRTIIATPHIAPGIKPFSREVLESKVTEARWYCEQNGFDMNIHLGSEIFYNDYAERLLVEQRIPTLAGSNKVLLEFPDKVSYEELERAINTTLRSGLIPVLAHIERYNRIIFSPKKLCQLKDKYQVFFQIDADCLLNERKYVTNKVMKSLLNKRVIDFVSTDAHDVEIRKCNMTCVYEKLKNMVGDRYADQLTGNHYTIGDFMLA